MIVLTNGNGWAVSVAWERNKCYSRTKFTKNSANKGERHCGDDIVFGRIILKLK